jgi:endonuclease-3
MINDGISVKGGHDPRRRLSRGFSREELLARRLRLSRIWERLEGQYPVPSRPAGPLLDGLIRVLLSQNTSDANSAAAFARLKERFRSWQEVERASAEEVEEAIRPAGISRVRGARIKEILRTLEREKGAPDLEFLRELGPGEAMDFLLGLPGIGIKSASVLLLFYLGHPYFPVDTHVYRVGRRTGLIPSDLDMEGAHRYMNLLVPDEIKYPLHMALVAHGRRVCKARQPRCHECVLEDTCEKVGLEVEAGREKAKEGGARVSGRER